MLTALLLPIVWAQSAHPLGPVVPAGANQAFVEASLAVQESLKSGDVDTARRMASILPKRRFTIAIRENDVSPALMPELRDTLNAAVQNWQRLVPRLEFVQQGRPDVVVSFVESIPGRDGGDPPGAEHFFSTDPADPRLEVVIARKRGKPERDATPDEIHNEMLYAIGAYFGMAWTPIKGSAMGRSDIPGLRKVNVQPFEARVAIQMLDSAEEHRKLAEAGKPVEPAKPKLFMDPMSYRGTPVRQGDAAQFSIQLSNLGNAPLQVSLIPDCTCLSLRPIPPIKPGDTLLVPVFVNTVDFTGDLAKRIEILSNDVEKPTRAFQFEMHVEPLWQFHNPKGDVVVAAEQGSTAFDLYLLVAEGVKLSLTSLDILGVNGVVSAAPFKGNVPGKGQASGYKIGVKLDEALPAGRNIGNVVVRTSDERFPAIDYGFSVQKGIVALPESVYFGEIGRSERTATFRVSRPGQPFRITKIESDSPHLSATWVKATNNDDWVVTVVFDGKSLIGRFAAVLTLATDDARQPRLQVPVQARIR